MKCRAHDIAYFKKQQWSIGYYALLLYAGIVGSLSAVHGTIESWERVVASLLAFGAAVIGAWLVIDLTQAIQVRRKRLAAVRDAFGDAFGKAWAAQLKPGKHRVDDVETIAGIIYVAIGVGACVAIRAAFRISG